MLQYPAFVITVTPNPHEQDGSWVYDVSFITSGEDVEENTELGGLMVRKVFVFHAPGERGITSIRRVVNSVFFDIHGELSDGKGISPAVRNMMDRFMALADKITPRRFLGE